MTIANTYKIHSIEIVPNGGAALTDTNPTIGNISNVSMPTEVNLDTPVSAGDVFASIGRLDFKNAALSFTSEQIKVMLDQIGVRGVCIDGTNIDEINVYIAKYECSGPVSGPNHIRHTLTKGMLFMNSLSANHGERANASATLTSVYDGVNSPVSTNPASDLPNATQLASQNDQWTISEKSIVNDVAVLQKKSLSVEFGVTTSTEGADGELYDSYGAIDQVLPVVSVSGINPKWFGLAANGGILGTTGQDFGLTGKSVQHDDNVGVGTHTVPANTAETVFFLRKLAGGSGFVADATAQHIAMSANGLAYFDNLLSASGVAPAQTSMRIATIKDGDGNAPLLFNTAIAIPATLPIP